MLNVLKVSMSTPRKSENKEKVNKRERLWISTLSGCFQPRRSTERRWPGKMFASQQTVFQELLR